jgi:hypothetical protein
MLYLVFFAALLFAAVGLAVWATRSSSWRTRRAYSLDGKYLVVEQRRSWWGFFEHAAYQVEMGTPAWRAWLAENDRFTVRTEQGYCYLQRERRGRGWYWYAYKWHTHGRKASRLYVGKLEGLAPHELGSRIQTLEVQARADRDRYEADRARRRRAARRVYDRRRRGHAAASAPRDGAPVDPPPRAAGP